MKQRKVLDLNSKIAIEAMFLDTGLEVTFKIAKKEYRITDSEVKELRDWLSTEVLKEQVQTPKVNVLTQEQAVKEQQGAAPVTLASGPRIIKPGEVIPQDDLDKRTAVVTQGGAKDLTGSLRLINSGDQLQVHNMSGVIARAGKAFSPEHINDGGGSQ